MAKIKAWKYGDASAPTFSTSFDIVKKAVLQRTDLKANNNKYYAIELHLEKGKKSPSYRVFTHYGRTDDLETNPNAGQKECRYFTQLAEAEASYAKIYKQKTSKSKGYQEVSLASSKIGSQQARGTSSGDVDNETLSRIKDKNGKPKAKAKIKPSSLPAGVQTLVQYIYSEATTALTKTVSAKITANGIETPLGVLTLGQIDKGQSLLDQAFKAFNTKKMKGKAARLEELSGEFYTAIPHRIGRTRAAIQSAVLDSLAAFEEKQETLQLMRDMLSVNGEGNVLFDAQVDGQYTALGCGIAELDRKSAAYGELEDYVLSSQIKSRNIKIKNIYSLKREPEFKAFKTKVGNERLLFHGSRIQNWVGLLSRGILMPKIVVSMGVNRTDAGWLGSGIYFGDAACTSAFYTTSGKGGTRFMAVARVALGKMKTYTKITYGLTAPPAGYDSCHGVRSQKDVSSEFDDDEYVIYDGQQQRLEYLVEFKL